MSFFENFRMKTTVAKISESENIFPVGATMSHKSVDSVPKSFPGDGQLGKILQEKDEQLKAKDGTIEVKCIEQPNNCTDILKSRLEQ